MKNIESLLQALRKITFVSLVVTLLASPFGLSPSNAEAQNEKSVLCVKRASKLSGLVYSRSSTKCLPGERKIASLRGEQGPAGPSGPTGPAAPLTVDPVHAGGTLVAAGSNVKFGTVKFLSGNISYDASTGVITFPESGYYLFTWQVAVDGLAGLPAGYDPQATPPYASFELSGSPGDLGGATLPTHLGSLTGNAIIENLSPPFTVSLKNSSPWSVNLAGAKAPKATLSVTRLYTEFGPIMLHLELN